ncbi:glyoxalase [Nocardia camponoti]|uniref:Glyoxalase n=1 Tax=Nocardia camponoti TaxID=1616106 RepID=A0A917QRB1_9NOCA|nr:glyoxalase [Nocardia camponoti]
MLGHLGVNVPDLQTAKSYYDKIMPILGFCEYLSADDQVAYRPDGGKPGTYLFLYPSVETGGYSRHRTGLQHLAFMVKTWSAVHEVHQFVARLGSTVVHEPQEFPQYPQPYFATFWIDPFGLMLEAVCHYTDDTKGTVCSVDPKRVTNHEAGQQVNRTQGSP